MKIQKSTVYLVLFLVILSGLLIGSLIGCNEKKHIKPPVIGPAAGSGPVGGGDTQSIKLTASPSSTITVVGDEQATVTITALIENNIGQPMPDGTPVYWEASVGTLSATTGTSSNGSSSVTLTFPKNYTGCGHVTARSGDAQETIMVCVESVTPTPTPSKVFIVRTDKSLIDTSAGDIATISATAMTDGQPDVGIQVSFTVSGPGILKASADETDESGIASVELRGNNTGTTQQTVTVTATTTDGRSGSVQILVDP